MSSWYNPSPSAPELYSQVMAGMYDEYDMLSLPGLFQAFFGRPESGGETQYIDHANEVEFDIIRGDEKRAPLVLRGSMSSIDLVRKALLVEEWSSGLYTFPLSKLETPIHVGQLLKRSPGRSPYEMESQQARLRAKGWKAHKEHLRRMARMFEFLSAQSVINGTMPRDDIDESSQKYDFGRNANLADTVDTSWSDASATILTDLAERCDALRQIGHVQPAVFLCGEDCIQGMQKNTELLTLADNRRFDLFNLLGQSSAAPQNIRWLLDAGAQYRGMIVLPNGYMLSILSTNDGYNNTAGTFTKYLADDVGLVMPASWRADRAFGPFELLDPLSSDDEVMERYFGISPSTGLSPMAEFKPSARINPRMFQFDAYRNSDRTEVTIRTQTAPIFVPTQVDAVAKLTVTAAG